MRPYITVATWNVGGAAMRLCNLPLVASALQEANADLVFLSEIMRGDGWADVRYGVNQVLDLQQRCGYPYAPWIDASALSPLQGGGVKMVALLSRFPLTNPVPQPAIEDEWWNGVYRALEVQADIDGVTWFLYTLRFSPHRYENFATHCAFLRDRIQSLPPGTPVIAAGDFNGGAHHWKVWRESGMTDPSVVRVLPAPLRDLIAGANLANATEGEPLQPEQSDGQNPPSFLPPHIVASDLILFRGRCERVRITESRPPAGCSDSYGYAFGPDHALVVATLAPEGTAAALAAATSLLGAPGTRKERRTSLVTKSAAGKATQRPSKSRRKRPR